MDLSAIPRHDCRIVQAELGRPSALRPDKGKVAIFVDCSAVAEPTFEGRGGEELLAELSVTLQRCLLGGTSGAGAGIDLTSLIVAEGKICWDLYIDGLVVSSDGNLLDSLDSAPTPPNTKDTLFQRDANNPFQAERAVS
ncbi:Exosome complex exonuclease RRP42 [Linum grandiflorum]